MSSTTSSRLLSLPQELLEAITCLFEGSPTLRSLREQPTHGMVESDCRPLKNISQTCRSMRSLTFNRLFEYTRLRLTIFHDENYWSPPRVQKRGINDFLAFTTSQSMIAHIRSLVVYTAEYICDPSAITQTDLSDASGLTNPGSAFEAILDALDPELVTIIASPVVLSSLTSYYMDFVHAWAFAIPLQVLHLQQPLKQARTLKPTPFAPCNLMHSRPWTHCVLNEGSSLPVYRTYEYYLKRQPSILPSIIYRSASMSVNAYSTIESLEHITIFPTSSHVTIVSEFLRCLPNLKRLALSMRPPASSDFLSDVMNQHNFDIADVWAGYVDMDGKVMSIMESSPDDSPIREITMLNHVDETDGIHTEYCPMGWRKVGQSSYIRDDSFGNLRPLEE